MITPEREDELSEQWVSLPPPWDAVYQKWRSSLTEEEQALVDEWDEEVADYVRNEM